ncbi:MAG: ATP-binding protein [Humidesulfovibrio sp.]|uniref:sensor histidine kinase n=1 Tax=Humidesulfovibrio sp. TaxID=2910988 RepID=UPI0027351C88|nr:ATP-binding protein [Humidesulfovibrio sp.]MDP2848685.1 ATP-binding protein [Humidesulfovibrio sp.]
MSAPRPEANHIGGARKLLSKATGARVWKEQRLVLWLHFLLPPVLAALVVAATFATPPLAALLAGAVLFLAACSARGLMSRLSRAEEAKNLLTAQLIQSQKLAAVGELSAGIAHEINNPIAIIAQETEWAAHLLSDAEKASGADFAEVRDSLREIRSQVDRCKNITHKLLDFARKREPVLQEVDVARLVDDMARLVDKEASYKNVTLTRTLPENLPRLRTDAPLLRQVVLNLMTNALHAVDKGGLIEVTAQVDEEFMNIHIKDNGHGIDPKDMDKIFNPFFTTKPPGQGTGLGLSLCHNMVSGMAGQICVESQLGKGTTFTIRLPRKV